MAVHLCGLNRSPLTFVPSLTALLFGTMRYYAMSAMVEVESVLQVSSFVPSILSVITHETGLWLWIFIRGHDPLAPFQSETHFEIPYIYSCI